MKQVRKRGLEEDFWSGQCLKGWELIWKLLGWVIGAGSDRENLAVGDGCYVGPVILVLDFGLADLSRGIVWVKDAFEIFCEN